MPRDGSGIYSVPGGTAAVSAATIGSAAYNAFLADLAADLNAARPVSAGGTGVTSLAALKTALNLAVGVDVQAWSAKLDTLAALASVAALASWAVITRGSGFDTFAATPSSANLRSLLTDETGTGAAVFGTSPTIATPVITGPDITIVKAPTETVYTITDGAAFAIDPTNGAIQVVTLGANRTPVVANFAAGQSVVLGIDDGTARTVTWSTIGVVWTTDSAAAPTLATTGYTWVVLWRVGSVYYGARVGNNA